MAGSSLLTLLDDIATLLDDISVMGKLAAKNSRGIGRRSVAQCSAGDRRAERDRELPVVWGVAKGSFINKVILVTAGAIDQVLLSLGDYAVADAGRRIPLF